LSGDELCDGSSAEINFDLVGKKIHYNIQPHIVWWSNVRCLNLRKR